MNSRTSTLAAVAATLLLGVGLSWTAAEEPVKPEAGAASAQAVQPPADPVRSDVPAVLVPGATTDGTPAKHKRCGRNWTTPCYDEWCPFPDPVWRFRSGSINADGDCVPGHWEAKKGKRRHCGC